MQVTEAAMLLLSEVSEKREPKEGISAYLALHSRLKATEEERLTSWDISLLGECAFVLGDRPRAKAYFRAAANATSDPTVLGSPAD